eukprot:3934032-Rhodomonas_salina.1
MQGGRAREGLQVSGRPGALASGPPVRVGHPGRHSCLPVPVARGGRPVLALTRRDSDRMRLTVTPTRTPSATLRLGLEPRSAWPAPAGPAHCQAVPRSRCPGPGRCGITVTVTVTL